MTPEVEGLRQELTRALEAARAAQGETNILRQQAFVLQRDLNEYIRDIYQLVASIVSVKATRHSGAEVRQFATEISTRVAAIGAVVALRDISGLSDRVDLRACLERLAPELQSTYCSRRGIGFGLSLGHLLVEARTAHALCLIVAELVSNACKHAFAGRAFGYVEIGSEVIDRERSRIWVADNGIGLAARAAAQFSGLDIVQQLAKGIGADLVRETLLGTRVTVSFSNAS